MYRNVHPVFALMGSKKQAHIRHLSFQKWQVAHYPIVSIKKMCYVSSVRKRGGNLKINIIVDPEIADTQITVSCSRLTPEIEKMMATLRMMEKKLTASKAGEIYLLDIAEIIYVDTIERKTFVYTKKDVYESSLKLYELEQQLCEYGFFRAGKSCLVQLKYIKSLKMDLNRRIKVTLENGEQIMVSRQYADELKKRLGVK